ncbi:ArsR/SmtB family transcription factor [Microbacteriaceae bacterium 4G12]
MNYVNQQEYFEDAAGMMRAIAHPVRLGILKELIENGPTNVTTLVEDFDIPQSTISQHLSKLKSNQIVKGRRYGLEVYYEVVDEKAKELIGLFVA